MTRLANSAVLSYDFLRQMAINPNKTTPWVDKAIFSVNRVPVIRHLKNSWQQIRDEYMRARFGATAYPLSDLYSGKWLVTSLRSNSVEINYLDIATRTREIIPAFGAEAVDKMTPEQVIAAHQECCDIDEAENRAKHPTLTSLLDPLYPETCFMYNYSLMRPGVRLVPHSGVDSGCIRVHLCLRDDPGCWLNVMGVQRVWKEGEVFAFDDANIHLAEHHGKRDRLVVIMDFKKSYISNELNRIIRPAKTKSATSARK